jgi:type I restriction enzyme M protein
MLKRLAAELLIQFRKSEELERKIKENLAGLGYEL